MDTASGTVTSWLGVLAVMEIDSHFGTSEMTPSGTIGVSHRFGDGAVALDIHELEGDSVRGWTRRREERAATMCRNLRPPLPGPHYHAG